jgi:hypothetical protein
MYTSYGKKNHQKNSWEKGHKIFDMLGYEFEPRHLSKYLICWDTSSNLHIYQNIWYVEGEFEYVIPYLLIVRVCGFSR